MTITEIRELKPGDKVSVDWIAQDGVVRSNDEYGVVIDFPDKYASMIRIPKAATEGLIGLRVAERLNLWPSR